MAISGGAICTDVASSATVVTITTARNASGVSRKGLVIYNDSSAVLKIKFGTAASATSFSYSIAANGGVWELPFGATPYQGIITGIWASANGFARVTELV